jgi:eukaryotic-like serine/threonine-protein kinase
VVGELIAGRYEVEDLVGSGGMSSVFCARDLLLERRVALKFLHEHFTSDSDYVERFRREARSAAQLSHPNIVTVIDRGEADGRQFIVFEYVDGDNLKELLRRQGPPPVPRALQLAVQIGRALAFAHSHGLVHRDVKPQNVLIGDGHAKVTDFGIARSLDTRGVTQTGTVMGTSDYMSPEQANGEAASELSDEYSLACVLFELLTGRVPFPADNAVAAALRQINDPAPSARELRPEVPLRLDAALRRAMAKDPGHRFPSMDEFVAELKACLGQEAAGETGEEATLVLSSNGSDAARRRRSPLRRPRPLPLLAAAAALVAGAAAAVALLVGGGGKSTPNPSPAQAQASSGGAVHLRAVTSYDPPPGDGSEHNDQVAFATDGNPSTSWETDHYNNASFGNLKRGVGLVLDAGSPTKLSKLIVQTTTPGLTAIVKAGSSELGPFDPVSSSQTVSGSTSTFSLRVPDPRRYYLLWITQLGSALHAEIDEVTAR